MPVFYLNDNLTIEGLLVKRKSIHPLKSISEKGIKKLLEQGLIRELSTPPLSTLEGLKKYATILEKAGIVNLGDFAFADLSQIPTRIKGAKEELPRLQALVLDLINPDKPIVLEDCGCGESPSPLTSTE
jgi:hypothetical protein